ncbi:MAG: MFS transporter [Anaerolineales bacterium]|nr:MFS transporter [Anaerolineales bacterium]
MKTTQRKNLYLLAFTLVVVMLGFGMIIPIMPFFIDQLGATGSDLGLLVAIAALTEFTFGPLWGSLSDRTGRKPILMIGMLGYGLSMLFFGLSTELWMLYASRALSGVLSSAALATAMAYIGDSTSDQERGGGMGLLGAAAGAGTIIGPGLGGLLGSGSYALPFFVAAGMSLAALLLVALLLPESLPPEKRSQGKSQTGLGSLRQLWQALFSPIGFLLFLAFLATFGTSNFESVFGLYMLKKLDYGPEQVGAILTVMGVIALLGRGLLTGFVTCRWGEARVIQASLVCAALGFVLLLLANSFPAVLATTGLYISSTTFLRPSIHALTSKRATLGQGAAMGLSNSFVSLGRVVGPIYAGVIFDINPSYPYISGAVILLVCFVISLVWLRGKIPDPGEKRS